MEETAMDEDIPGASLWDEFKKQLDEELVADQVDEMRFLMKDKINSEVFPSLTTPSDLLTYLENNMAGDEAWTVVEHVFRITKDHFLFQRSSIAEIVNKYRLTRANFTCSTFIGRQDDVRGVSEKFQKYGYKGVWIHGFGGLGKTALAREVCATLANEMDVIPVDMKYITSALDFARQILKLVVKTNEPSSNFDSLIDMIVLPEHDKLCILLDNIEDVFLSSQPDTIRVLNRCVEISSDTIKWIITCRLPPDHETIPKLDKHVAVVQLKPLDEEYSTMLLKLRAKPKEVPPELVESILKQANGNPLAIGLVGAVIKETMCDTSSYSISSSIDTGEIEDILHFTCGSLNEVTQRKLLELSVVGTSEFDITIASAILQTTFNETVMTMMELTNRHVIQRVEWGSFRSKDTKSQVELEYCIHPLVLRYLENKHTADNIDRAQQNFCVYMFRKIEKAERETRGFEVNYLMMRNVILDSEGIYKSMFQVLTKQQFTNTSYLPIDRCIYLSKAAETVQLSLEDKGKLYDSLISNSSGAVALFWHIEHMATRIDMKQDADAIISYIEPSVTNNDIRIDEFTMGSFWYHKGRYLRMKKKFQDALVCHDKAIEYFRRYNYVAGVAQAQNGKANVYFDSGELGNARVAHEQARDTLNTIAVTDHPDLSTYDFNVGTVCLAIAEQKRRIHDYMGDEAKGYYEKALDMFRTSLKRDVAMGMTKSTQYATKLDNTAWCHYRLGNIEDAIATMQEYILAGTSPIPNGKTLTAYFRAGKSYMDWIRGPIQHDKETIRRLMIEAERCFFKVQHILTTHSSADLDDIDKVVYINYYRKLSGNFSKQRKQYVQQFCKRYEEGKLQTSDTSTSSSESTSSSSDSVESLSDEAMKEENVSGGEDDHGIPFAESEKRLSAQFESNFLTRKSNRLSSSESLPDEAMQEEAEAGPELSTGIPFAEAEKIESAQFENNILPPINLNPNVRKRNRSSSSDSD